MRARPDENIRKCEGTLSGVTEIAPEVEFGGYKAADFETLVQEMRDVRDELDELETRTAAVRARRDLVDVRALEAEQLIVNGIIGNRAYGPDSPLYAATGRKRVSDRKSGLTRKKKTVQIP
jgi:hypothetical protein